MTDQNFNPYKSKAFKEVFELMEPALSIIHKASNIVDTTPPNEEPTAKEELKLHVCPACFNISLITLNNNCND